MEDKKKQRLVLWIVAAVFILIGLFFFLMWLFDWRFEESTDDAYVHGNQVVVTPQISGFVDWVSVDDTEIVEEGHLLVRLDTTDPRTELESAKNGLAETVRDVVQLFQRVSVLKAQLEKQKAEFKQASLDYQHRKALIEIGGVSKEDFEHSRTDLIAAFASYIGTGYQLKAAESLVEGTTALTHPLVLKSADQVKLAYIHLKRCEIHSPVRGMVAMKRVQVGESVGPETPLMTIIPLDQIWVDANFKEVQLAKVRIGQPVSLHSDMYGTSVPYQGKVIGLAAGTGSVFSVLPPQNATGNWIKIVQRLPVRIGLDPKQVAEHPLRLGLSMHARVDIHNTSGDYLPDPAPPGPLYETNIFADQMEGADELIQSIIEKNLPKETGDGRRD